MIDYIKMEHVKPEIDIRKNPYLSDLWVTRTDVNGEILEEIAEFKNLKFSIKKSKYSHKYQTKISGSIHKYNNNGVHNFNDFCFGQIISVLNDIETKFKIPKDQAICNLEFGVNIRIPFEPKVILENLITHKGTKFSFVSKPNQSYYQCEHSQFIIKIYDKSLQYGLDYNLIRIEIKVLKMQYLATNGIQIRTLGFLRNKANYERLGLLLSKVFNEILIDCETLQMQQMTPQEKENYIKATNPRTWQKRDTSQQQKKLQRLSEKYYLLIEKNIKPEVQKKLILANLVKDKWCKLSEIYRPQIMPFVRNLPFNYNVNFGHSVSHISYRPSSLDYIL